VQKLLAGINQANSVLKTVSLVFALVAATLVPIPVISFPAGIVLLIVLPGIQIIRWLGLYAHWREARTLILALAAGVLTAPVVVYWVSKAVGFNRPAIFIAITVFIIGLAWLNNRQPVTKYPAIPIFETHRQSIFFGLLTALLMVGIVAPLFRGHAGGGVYPVEMADWFKHFGVSWSIRHTGVPPVDIFFFGDPARGRLSYLGLTQLTV
jgi:hypothetical protein